MCGGSIPFRYFLTELALAVTGLYLYLMFPPAEAGGAFPALRGAVRGLAHRLRLANYPARDLDAGNRGRLPVRHVRDPEVGWKASLGGIALGAGVLFGLGELYLLIRKQEGVGMGDVFLVAMVGAFLGWRAVLFTLFVGSIFGSVGGIVAALSRRPSRPSGRRRQSRS